MGEGRGRKPPNLQAEVGKEGAESKRTRVSANPAKATSRQELPMRPVRVHKHQHVLLQLRCQKTTPCRHLLPPVRAVTPPALSLQHLRLRVAALACSCSASSGGRSVPCSCWHSGRGQRTSLRVQGWRYSPSVSVRVGGCGTQIELSSSKTDTRP